MQKSKGRGGSKAKGRKGLEGRRRMRKSNRGMRKSNQEPSLEAKRRSRLVLAARSMTNGPRPACQERRVTNEGVKRRDLNRRPCAKRGGS